MSEIAAGGTRRHARGPTGFSAGNFLAVVFGPHVVCNAFPNDTPMAPSSFNPIPSPPSQRAENQVVARSAGLDDILHKRG